MAGGHIQRSVETNLYGQMVVSETGTAYRQNAIEGGTGVNGAYE